MALSRVTYSNKEINKAGIVLSTEKARDHWKHWGEFLKVDSWRSSHAYPLRVIATLLRRRAKMLDPTAIVSRRLKRMESILVKLNRNPNMKITTIQDIGGCRAVVQTVEQVMILANQYKSYPAVTAIVDEEPSIDNYIHKPKPDGYRSLHLIFRYRPRKKEFEHLAGRRIEIQIRSKLQHAWATAVETVDIFGKQNLKQGGGEPEWKRLFALVGTLFAMMEECPIVPGTPTEVPTLLDELSFLWKQLHVVPRLSLWANSIKQTKESVDLTGSVIYLLILDLETMTIDILGWDKDQIALGYDLYARTEQRISGNKNMTAVLASAESLDELEQAFPNYYADTGNFIGAVESILNNYNVKTKL